MRLRDVGNPDDEALVQTTLRLARPFASREDLTPLIEQLRGKRVVMLGEASHGTHEFYEWRRVISEALILDHGFRFIAVEGDWPPAWHLNEYVHGGEDSAEKYLSHFSRWPTWMWANRETAELARWLRSYNDNVAPGRMAGFYGLDVYSLFESIDAAVEQVHKISPFLARRMRTRYECFEPFERNEKLYARSLLEFPAGCQENVLLNLRELLQQRLSQARLPPHGDLLFSAAQNARIVADAENYFRVMMNGTEDSWNVRDRHMHDTLTALLDRYGPEAKGIVWAHNTHVGDYRATDMAEQGQINIGGLARETWGREEVALVGFGTYQGEVIASPAWDGAVERMEVPRGKQGSYEAAFHKVAQEKGENFYLDLRNPALRQGALGEMRGHRAIGVVYHPAYELLGNYVPTSLANRYDAFLVCDRTGALDPIHLRVNREEIPETWPVGM
jgi:erythromycin esterase-like protein